MLMIIWKAVIKKMKNSVKYYGSMVRIEVTKTTDDEITVHLEDVSAIPIEWIEKYLESYKEHFIKLSDKSKETSGAGWVIDVLESTLREWEKENGRSE